MKVHVVPKKSASKDVDVNLVICTQKSSGSKIQIHCYTTKEIKSLINDSQNEKVFDAGKEKTLFYRHHGDHALHTLTIGLGNPKDTTSESWRRIGAIAYKELIRHKAKTARINTKDFGSNWAKKLDIAIQAFSEGLTLASYKFDDYLEKKMDRTLKNVEIIIENSAQKRKLQKAVDDGVHIGEGVNYGRWLGDNPGNLINPVTLATNVQKTFKGTGVKVTAWDKARLKKEKMGLLLSVGQGSAVDSRLIILEYKGAGNKKPVCFVGKGITFDTGGISLKPPQAMEEMKYDMCGAANIIGTMLALAKNKAKTNAIAIIAAAENMPGPAATKPGDIHEARNGTSVEIHNTDAEGRLALADALCVATEKKPEFIVDAATLTGAMVIALGCFHTGYFTRDEKMSKKIGKALTDSQEKAWRLPLDERHIKLMKGTHADLKNIGGRRDAGSAQGAAFLSHFVSKDIPWAHFDIAGTAWNVGNLHPYCPKYGASGIMVRTFYNLAING